MADIKDLIKKGEGITIEFKESKKELNKDTFESVCAMLNRFGGHLLLGVEDDGTVCGVDRDCVDKIKKNFVTQMNNPDKINPTFYTQLQEYEIDGKVVIYAQIPTTPDVHRTAGKIFDRNEDGDFNITNNTALVAQLYNRKYNLFTELKVFPYATIDDLDMETFSKVRIMAHNRAGREHLWESMTDMELLKSTDLYRKDFMTGEEGLTLAGILLLGKPNLIFSALPHYKTDAIVRRKNLDRYDDREIVTDNLIKSYYKLMDFINKHMDDKFYLEGDQRIDVRNKIFREICSNILIHREFSNPYPAKLLIENQCVRTENANKPNGFGTIDIEAFSPYTKNPAIAKFFREIGLADELGSGVKNVNKYLKIYSGYEPEFIEGDIFKTIIPLDKTIDSKVRVENKPVDQDNNQVNDQDSDQDNTLKKILSFCVVPRTKAEIVAHCGFKHLRSFTLNYLKPLIDSNQIIMTIPEKPTSRNQKYVISKGENK